MPSSFPGLMLDLQCLQTAVTTAQSYPEKCDTSKNLTVKLQHLLRWSPLWFRVTGAWLAAVFVTRTAGPTVMAAAVLSLVVQLTAAHTKAQEFCSTWSQDSWKSDTVFAQNRHGTFYKSSNIFTFLSCSSLQNTSQREKEADPKNATCTQLSQRLPGAPLVFE